MGEYTVGIALVICMWDTVCRVLRKDSYVNMENSGSGFMCTSCTLGSGVDSGGMIKSIFHCRLF